MVNTEINSHADPSANRPIWARTMRVLHDVFLANGILPFVLVAAIIFMGIAEPRFLSYDNLFNLGRHSTYLIIISVGQMLALLVRGIDMSVGSTVALVSVTTALAITGTAQAAPDAPGLAIVAGVAAGMLTGAVVGLINGIGIAVLSVSPFIMTVGMMSIATGVALTLSGGMPVYGMPREFGQIFSNASLNGLPVPVLYCIAVLLLGYYMLNWTVLGRRIYSLGGNLNATRLAGVNTTFFMVLTYVLCSVIVAFGAILLTARVNTGEATLGTTLLMESITACVIGGVSFFGGIGRISNVFLGAIFVTILTNGMNLLRIESYVQQIVLGVFLIAAVVVDQIRVRMLRQERIETG
ncbi:MAG: ABC transporter permease [Confluentimicrobium sp.]|nr:ABC transporter permease [Actibacterium sp.]